MPDPKDPNRTMAYTVDQFDPKGKVQALFESQLIRTKPLTISNLRTFFAQGGLHGGGKQ